MIPGAMKTDGVSPVGVSQCGGGKGVVTASMGATKTVCCKYYSQ